MKAYWAAILCGILCAGALYGEEPEAPAHEAQTETVKLVKLRIIISGDLYEWTTEGMAKPEETIFVLKEQTVISFTGLRPGKDYTQAGLEGEIARTRYRLEESGYFYDVNVSAVPPRRNPGERTVIIEVTEGFLMRFGGGNAYAMFGRVGLGGERQEVRAYGGWNRNGLAYVHHRLGGLPLLLGGSLFYYGLGGGAANDAGLPELSEDTRPLAGTITTGVYGGPDFQGGLGMDAVFPLEEGSPEWIFSAGPYLSYNPIFPAADGGWPITMNVNLKGFLYPQYQSGKALAAAALHIPLPLNLEWSLLGSGGDAPEGLPSFGLFNLYEGLTLNGYEGGGIRSGEDRETLMTRAYALGSTELRYTALDRTLARILRVKLILFAFAEGARLFDKEAWADAFGAGLRLHFDNPIFAWFSFSYGWTHQGRGRFIFSGAAGF
jgi:hypothetical protein